MLLKIAWYCPFKRSDNAVWWKKPDGQIPWGAFRRDNYVEKIALLLHPEKGGGGGGVEWVQLELTDALQYHTLYDNFI